MRKPRIKVKTIDVTAKEWFDKVNGNSYFSTIITINYSKKTAKIITMPMQYGYGDHYRDMAFKMLQELKYIPKQQTYVSYWSYYDQHNIIARHNKHENCLKRDVVSFAQ